MRKILLSGRETHYVLKRSRRRSVGLRITPEGLAVSAPQRMPEHVLEALLREKSGWILKKMDEAKPSPAQKWAEGEEISFLGTPYPLRILHCGRIAVGISEGFLEVRLPDPSPERIEKAVHAWYKRTALECFAERIDHYCPRLAVERPRLFLSNAKTRWGSCNSRGEVRLNWRLVRMPLDLVDYVVAHELSHLAEMNHSQAFWDKVASVYPAYRSARAALRRHPLW